MTFSIDKRVMSKPTQVPIVWIDDDMTIMMERTSAIIGPLARATTQELTSHFPVVSGVYYQIGSYRSGRLLFKTSSCSSLLAAELTVATNGRSATLQGQQQRR